MTTSAPSEGIPVLLGPSGANVGVLAPSTSDWLLAVSIMMDKPDAQICSFDVAGQAPNPKWLLDYPCIQVIVRGKPRGYQEAFRKARDVYDVLLGLDPRTINGDRWDAITVLSPPALIGYDSIQRPSISTNYRVILEPAATSLTTREPL